MNEEYSLSTDIFHKIEQWCDSTHCGAATGLKRLVLSFFNGQAYPYAFSVCVKGFDFTRDQWALELITDYLARGESPELVRLGSKYAKEGIPALASWEV